MQGGCGVLVLLRGIIGLRIAVRGEVRDDQVAALGHRVHQRLDQAVRVLVGREEVQDRHQQHRDRLAEVEQPAQLRVGEYPAWVAQVLRDDRGAVVAVQQVAGVGQHDRVVVHVHHAAVRCDILGHLVHAVHRGQAGADVEELADAEVSQVPDHPDQELAVLDGGGSHDAGRHHGDDALGRRPVGGIVVLTAEVVVVHPRGARDIRAKGIRGLRHAPNSLIRRPRCQDLSRPLLVGSVVTIPAIAAICR